MEKSNEKIIAGVDILPGYSTLSKNTQPHYAVVFIKNEEVIDSFEDVSFSRLIRLLWEYKADILAIDNVFELARDTDTLIQLIKILPPNTKIVQVTGWGPSAVNIKSIAKKLGIEVKGKLDPLKTAYLAALIASRGGGAVVKMLEEKTKIIVSRGRSVSHGGMSYDRYKRSVRAGILTVTREIKKILDNNELDYDLVFRRSKGGLEKSIFIVYASRDKLYGLIKPFKNKSVKLSIIPIYRDKIIFEENKSRRRNRGLIVGIDPGISTGLAIIDLDGNPLLLYSSKNIDRSELINMITQLGEPVLISTDTHQPPELVKKIASTLNAKLYTPQQDLTTTEKQEIINKIKSRYQWIEVEDSHERDALAAAYKAYTWISDKLKNIDSKIRDMNIGLNKERIRINVIRGKSFAEALEEELNKYLAGIQKKNEKVIEKNLKDIKDLEEKYKGKIRKLYSRISYLESLIQELRKQLEEKDRVISELKLELKIARTEKRINGFERKYYMLKQEYNSLKKEFKQKDNKIEELYNRISFLEKIINMIYSGEYLMIPYIKNLCASEVKRVFNDLKYNLIYVDEIYPLDSEAIMFLKKNKIGLITSRDYGDLFKEIRIPLTRVNKEDMVEYNDYVLIRKNILDIVNEQWRIVEELDHEDEYKRIIRLVKEYQERRKRLSK